MSLRCFVVLTLSVLATVIPASSLSGPEDLSSHYYEIFKSGNRNAASHLWASFVLDRSSSMPAATLKNVFKGFCPVSGSPLPDNPRTQYKVTLPTVSGDVKTGVSHHCCWPCVCDLSDFVRIDTKTVSSADGPREYHVFVMGDPCDHPEKLEQTYTDPFSGAATPLQESAPELSCIGGKLKGATYSDHGYPILGMFFTDDSDVEAVGGSAAGANAGDPTFGHGDMCMKRKAEGYNSGMGLIFQLVAKINPIPNSPSLWKSGSLQQKDILPEATLPKDILPEAAVHKTSMEAKTSVLSTVSSAFLLAAVVGIAAWSFFRLRRLTPSKAKPEEEQFDVLE